MDEPTGGLDVSVQARLLDLLRGLVSRAALAAIIVTHDLAVARLLSHRIMVMKDGEVIETGLTDQVLDDPQRALHAAARLLDAAAMRLAMTAARASAVAKTFTMHLQGGVRLPVVARRRLSRSSPGECVVLAGPSGAGKSSILKMIYGNYRCDRGQILVRHDGDVDRHRQRAEPRQILRCGSEHSAMSASFCARCRAWRRSTSSPSRWSMNGDAARAAARAGRRTAAAAQHSRAAVEPAAGDLLRRRAAARQSSRAASCPSMPILLLDEPTASLDADNRAVVVDLIDEKQAARRRHRRHRP